MRVKSHLAKLTLIGLLVPGIPMMFFRYDIWDGAIIDYNLQVNKIESLRTWFFTSGWELQYYLIKFQYLLSEWLNVSSRSVILTISLVALIILSNEIYLLSKNIIRLPDRYAIFSSVLFLLQPTWNVLVSSVMNIHIVCLSLGMIGSRLLLDVKKQKKIVGASFVIIAFQLNSMLLFIPTLILVVKLIEALHTKSHTTHKREFFITLAMAITYFCLQRIFNPNEGAYSNYNNFAIPNSVQAMSFYLRDILHFSSFLIFPFLAIVMTIPKMMSHRSFSTGKQEHFTKLSLYLLMLLAAAAIPYILVGKSTNLFDLTDWNQRQSFIVTVPVAILTGLFLAETDQTSKSRPLIRIRVITSSVILIVSLSLLLNSFAIKLNRQIFEDKLVASLQQIEELPKPGLFQINGVGIPGPAFRTYESNFLLYRAYSSASWWSLIQKTREMNFSYPTIQGPHNSGVDVYQPSIEKCASLVRIESVGFENSVLNVVQTYFGGDPSSVRVLSFETLCGDLQSLNFQANDASGPRNPS